QSGSGAGDLADFRAGPDHRLVPPADKSPLVRLAPRLELGQRPVVACLEVPRVGFVAVLDLGHPPAGAFLRLAPVLAVALLACLAVAARAVLRPTEVLGPAQRDVPFLRLELLRHLLQLARVRGLGLGDLTLMTGRVTLQDVLAPGLTVGQCLTHRPPDA